MIPAFLEQVKRDYDKESTELDWDSYLAGYWAAVQRFGELSQRRRDRKESRREVMSELGYSRIGLNNWNRR